MLDSVVKGFQRGFQCIRQGFPRGFQGFPRVSYEHHTSKPNLNKKRYYGEMIANPCVL